MQFDVSKKINMAVISNGFESSISSGNWSVKRFKVERKGVTQVIPSTPDTVLRQCHSCNFSAIMGDSFSELWGPAPVLLLRCQCCAGRDASAHHHKLATSYRSQDRGSIIRCHVITAS